MIWADVFQCAVMIAGMSSVIIRGSIMQGGLGNVIRIARQGGRTTVKYVTLLLRRNADFGFCTV